MTDTVIIGGGKTGRGFIGRLLFESGIPFAIFDTNRDLVDKLNQSESYRIKFFSSRSPITIDGFEAFELYSPSGLEVIRNAKNIFISVGAENLETAARYLLMNCAKPKNIILCENAIDPSKIVWEIFKKGQNSILINFVETAIFCTTVNADKDSVDIISEEYHKLPYDQKTGKSRFFRTPFFEPETNFPILLKRKIYTYNTASAIIAYNGWYLGYSAFAEAANDPAILLLLRNFYSAINNAVCSEYGIKPDLQREFSAMSLKKFTNPEIKDSIERNARQPQRKMGPEERIAYPMRLLMKYNFNVQPLCRTAAMAIMYAERNETDWIRRYGTGQAGIVFSFLSGIADKAVIEKINFEYKNLKKA